MDGRTVAWSSADRRADPTDRQDEADLLQAIEKLIRRHRWVREIRSLDLDHTDHRIEIVRHQSHDEIVWRHDDDQVA